MTREEAINVVKNNWPNSSYTRLREVLETLIPELAESEDERNKKQIIDILLHGDTTAYDHEALAAWLEKQGEQKPAWSEDDEQMREDAIEAIKHLISTNESWSYLEDSLDWLKSLRPQPHWKPSEEQMKALKYALGEGGHYSKSALESLYSDLQKL